MLTQADVVVVTNDIIYNLIVEGLDKTYFVCNDNVTSNTCLDEVGLKLNSYEINYSRPSITNNKVKKLNSILRPILSSRLGKD